MRSPFFNPSISVVDMLCQTLPCVLVKVPDPSSNANDDFLVKLLIPHRRGRLPVRLLKSSHFLWHCADGCIEMLAIPFDSSDWHIVKKEIETNGLLVAEISDSDSNFKEQISPVEHWVLTSHGSCITSELGNDLADK